MTHNAGSQGDSRAPMWDDRARVARLTPPGPWWYIAVCEGCRWAGLSWKHKQWATDERDEHNARNHPTRPTSNGRSEGPA